jgi:outer membrane protein TolC
MRRMVLLVSFVVVSTGTRAGSAPLTFEDIVRRAAPDPALLARAAGLARLRRELAVTGGSLREGPTLEAELGPRRTEDGARKVEASARIEVPFLSDRRARAEADSRLRDGTPAVLAADAVESRLRLRAAYLDAWLAQERLEVIDAQAQAVERLLESVRKRVEAGADASYESALVEGEMLRSRSDSDGARAA